MPFLFYPSSWTTGACGIHLMHGTSMLPSKPTRWRHLNRQDMTQTLNSDVLWCLSPPHIAGSIFQRSAVYSHAFSVVKTTCHSGGYAFRWYHACYWCINWLLYLKYNSCYLSQCEKFAANEKHKWRICRRDGYIVNECESAELLT